MNNVDKELLEKIADFHGVPEGSYNIRINGKAVKTVSSAEIEIVSKTDKSGIDIIVKPNVKNKSLHLPVILTEGGISDTVYNDFYVGENSEVLIVAGCGIHNTTNENSSHSGVHFFHLGKNSKVKYVEKHLGEGSSKGGKILNPTTKIEMEDGAKLEMETTQLGGVSYSNRKTFATLKDGAKLVCKEKILTEQNQIAKTSFDVVLNGFNSSAEVVSRSVAKNSSKQSFVSVVKGNNNCFGHVECDGIVQDKAKITSYPKVVANNVNASLVHEAAIGKIAGEQIVKLMTLGLSEEQAQNEIIKGFLK